MLRLLTILLLSMASANAAIPIIFMRAGTNAVTVVNPTNDYSCPPIAEWYLEDSSSPLQDISTNNFDATASAGFFGSITYQVAGVQAYGIKMVDASASVVDHAKLRLTNSSFAVRAWYKHMTNTGFSQHRIFNKYSTVASGYELAVVTTGASGQFEFQWLIANGAPLKVVQGPVVRTNEWYHVVGTFNDTINEMELFINGVSQGTTSTVGNMVGNTLALALMDTTGAATYDELAIFDCAFSVANVINDFDRPFAFEDENGAAFQDPEEADGWYFTDPEFTL